jgi:methionyl-tRNA formyltransferase
VSLSTAWFNGDMRIVTLNNMPFAFNFTQQWAAQAGHEVVLAVTSPGPKSRRSDGYKEIAAAAGEKNIELLITTRMKTVLAPIVARIAPDMIVSFTFPWLLPKEVLQHARLGAVNLHPAALPAYRGPNVLRQFYDRAPVMGATLHWTDAEFDTGRILAQHTAPMPERVTRDAIFAVWPGLMMRTLAEGTAKAAAGAPGTPQDESLATYAAPFTPGEHVLDLTSPFNDLLARCTALNMLGNTARVMLDGVQVPVMGIEPTGPASGAPGQIHARDDGFVQVSVADADVRIKLGTP